ncbi:MAG: hypothetical protein ACXWN4_00835 [Candidatus Limnocylindrales bacterium]
MTAIDAPKRAETVDAGREQVDQSADESRSVTESARVAMMGAFDRVPDLLGNARNGASQVAEHLPEAVERARVGAQETATTLQTMSDPTLRLLAAGSIGLAVGLYLAGARRPLTLAAMVPAVIAGSAIASRPAQANPALR